MISNNVVQNPTIWGLLQTPDLYFLESDFAQNVSVLGNYLSAPYAPPPSAPFPPPLSLLLACR